MKDANGRELKVGDVVQLDPDAHLGEKDGFFAGCFMQVTELKSFGAQGFVPMPRERGVLPGFAYFRAHSEDMVYVGSAHWVGGVHDFEESEDEACG